MLRLIRLSDHDGALTSHPRRPGRPARSSSARSWSNTPPCSSDFHDLECQLDETCATTEELQRSYACLKEEYLALKRLLFGPRRERLPEAPGQGHLFDTEPAGERSS